MEIRGKVDFAGGAEGDSAARTLVDGLSDGAGSCSVFSWGIIFLRSCRNDERGKNLRLVFCASAGYGKEAIRKENTTMAKFVCNVISYTLKRTVDITVIVPTPTIPQSLSRNRDAEVYTHAQAKISCSLSASRHGK